MSGTVDGERVYEVVINAYAQQQAIKNVYYYRITAGAGTLNAVTLATAFIQQVQPSVEAALSNIYQGQTIVVRELDSDTDFTEQPYAGSGDGVGDFMPLHVSAVVRLLRNDKTTGPGRKAYGPIMEAHQADGELNATGQTLFDAIAAVLDDNLVLSGRTFEPVIIGGKRTPAGAAIPEGQWRWNTIDGADALALLGSQNSRKRRRGV